MRAERCVRLIACGVCCFFVGVAYAAPTMTGETSSPSNSIFAIGSPAYVTFVARGLSPNETRPLVIGIYDQNDECVKRMEARILADGKGDWKGTFPVPADRYGFFRVRTLAGEDLKLPKVGSRGAGCLTYAVVMDPKNRPALDPDTCFAGLHGDVVADCSIAPWLGMRVQMGYQRIFTDQAAYLQEFSRRQAMGWRTVGHIDASPAGPMKRMSGFLDDRGRAWLERGHIDWWDFLKDDEGRRCYRMILSKMAAAARSQMYWQKKRIYSIFWEPDLSAPSPRFLVEAAAIAHDAIKEADPEGLIALPTLSNISKLDFHRQLFELGILKYADMFDIHPYLQYPPEPNGFVDYLLALKRMLAEYGRGDIPMFGSESGISQINTVPAERLQMNGMIRVQLILLGEGFRFNCCFYGADYGGDHGERIDGDYGLMYNLELPKVRWGTHHISPRPVMPALSAFSRLLDGSRPTAKLDSLGGTRLGYAYQDAQGVCTLALWDYGGHPSRVDIPVGCSRVRVADIMGNERTMETSGGVLKIEVDESPVYVIGVNPVYWGKGGTMAARLAEEARRREYEREQARNFVLPSVRAVFDGDAPGVEIVARNRTREVVEVSVETRIRGVPEARKEVRTTLESSKEKHLRVSFGRWTPDPFKEYTIEVLARDPSGREETLSEKLNFLAADYVPDFGSWRNPIRYPVGTCPVMRSELHSGADDFSASMAFGWNEQYFLVDVLTLDDRFSNEKDGWWIWDGDSVQLGFAKARRVSASANDYGDAADEGLSEINFALTPKGVQAYRTRTFDLRRFPAGQCGEGRIDLRECPVKIERRNTSDGKVAVHYSMAIPWAFLNLIDVRAGDSVYFASFLNDRDESIGHVVQFGVFELQKVPPRHFGAVYLRRP